MTPRPKVKLDEKFGLGGLVVEGTVIDTKASCVVMFLNK